MSVSSWSCCAVTMSALSKHLWSFFFSHWIRWWPCLTLTSTATTVMTHQLSFWMCQHLRNYQCCQLFDFLYRCNDDHDYSGDEINIAIVCPLLNLHFFLESSPPQAASPMSTSSIASFSKLLTSIFHLAFMITSQSKWNLSIMLSFAMQTLRKFSFLIKSQTTWTSRLTLTKVVNTSQSFSMRFDQSQMGLQYLQKMATMLVFLPMCVVVHFAFLHVWSNLLYSLIRFTTSKTTQKSSSILFWVAQLALPMGSKTLSMINLLL